MGNENNLTSGECVTICKERYKELLDYERVALWVLDLIVVASLPNIEMKKDKLKEISNDKKYNILQEALKGK